MDGDNRRLKHHDRLRGPGHSSAARFAAMNNTRAVDSPALSAAERAQQMPYADYGGYTGTAFQAGSLHANEVPGTYQQEFARHQQQQPQHHQRQQHEPQRRGQPQQQQQQPQQGIQHHQQPSFNPYESAMLYGFQGPSAHSQGAYELVPQYSTRQSAATMDALSNQFGVPQYYAPEEPSSAGVVPQSVLSPYLSAQLQQQQSYSTNPQAASIARPSTTAQQQPFAATMADYTSIGTAPTARIDPQQHHQQQQQLSADPSLDEAYTQYQRALLLTFQHARAGRLVEASRSLLEISEWLVTNARDLGTNPSPQRQELCNPSWPHRMEMENTWTRLIVMNLQSRNPPRRPPPLRRSAPALERLQSVLAGRVPETKGSHA